MVLNYTFSKYHFQGFIMLYDFLIIYFVLINIIAVLITIYDKLSAKLNKRRVPEKTLLTVSALGGSVVMYIIMNLIRHKTRKRKFMIGIPVIIAIQILITVLFLVML